MLYTQYYYTGCFRSTAQKFAEISRKQNQTRIPYGPGVEIKSSQLGTNDTLKVEKLGIKFMISFKVMIIKTKFTVAKYD